MSRRFIQPRKFNNNNGNGIIFTIDLLPFITTGSPGSSKPIAINENTHSANAPAFIMDLITAFTLANTLYGVAYTSMDYSLTFKVFRSDLFTY
jgi:hypothetical protein